MIAYQCLRCRAKYSSNEVNWENSARYSDCTIWRCPHCKAQQDSRDIQKFLGVGGGGGGSVRQIDDEELNHDYQHDKYASSWDSQLW